MKLNVTLPIEPAHCYESLHLFIICKLLINQYVSDLFPYPPGFVHNAHLSHNSTDTAI